MGVTESSSAVFGCVNGGTIVVGSASQTINRPTLQFCNVASQFTSGDSTIGAVYIGGRR